MLPAHFYLTKGMDYRKRWNIQIPKTEDCKEIITRKYRFLANETCCCKRISCVFLIQILLAIGGWAFGSTPFKELTSNTFRMNQFVYEAIDFLREYKFDGLDVDWEYPR